jgi:hypothetical protein
MQNNTCILKTHRRTGRCDLRLKWCVQLLRDKYEDCVPELARAGHNRVTCSGMLFSPTKSRWLIDSSEQFTNIVSSNQ